MTSPWPTLLLVTAGDALSLKAARVVALPFDSALHTPHAENAFRAINYHPVPLEGFEQKLKIFVVFLWR